MKTWCSRHKNTSRIENYNQTSENASMETLDTSEKYTICNKMSVTNESVSVIEYLFDEGKCGEICWNGKVHYSHYLCETI